MADKPDMRVVDDRYAHAGERVFTAEKRDQYLDALRHGLGRRASARSIGVSHGVVYGYGRAHPEFIDERDAAEEEAVEAVESALFNTALDGNTTAQIFFLCNRAPDRWSDRRRPNNVTVTTGVQVGERALASKLYDYLAEVDWMDPEKVAAVRADLVADGSGT